LNGEHVSKVKQKLMEVIMFSSFCSGKDDILSVKNGVDLSHPF